MESLVVDTVWYTDFKKPLPNVDGKVFVITGTTSGTGYVAARTAAEKGGEVVVLNRSSARAKAALATLKEEIPTGKYVPIECDLQSFESVRKAASEIKAKYAKNGIFSLCWNAGIMATPDEATVDGYDTQMQTNHLSHFLLTAELFPLLQTYAALHEGDSPRVVNHSSGARHMTPNKCLERQYFEQKGGNLGGSDLTGGFSGAPFLRYFQSKLANAVFTKALHQKLQAKNSSILAICADPGISATSLGNHFGGPNAPDFKSMAEKMQSSEDGAMGIIMGMMDPNAESGVHYGPAGSKGPAVINEAKPYEVDPEAMKLLWETSQVATGVVLDI